MSTMTTKETAGREGQRPDGWAVGDEIPMMSDLPRTAHIESHATAGTGEEDMERESKETAERMDNNRNGSGPPGQGQTRVEKHILRTEDIV